MDEVDAWRRCKRGYLSHDGDFAVLAETEVAQRGGALSLHLHVVRVTEVKKVWYSAQIGELVAAAGGLEYVTQGCVQSELRVA